MRTFSAKRGGSNLKAKRKRLSIVFATLFAAKQGVCRAECTEATADDYATGAHVTSKKSIAIAMDFFICAARHNIICVAHATSFEL